MIPNADMDDIGQVDVTHHDLEEVVQPPRKILPPWLWRLELRPVGIIWSARAVRSGPSEGRWYREWGLVPSTRLLALLILVVALLACFALAGCDAAPPEADAAKVGGVTVTLLADVSTCGVYQIDVPRSGGLSYSRIYLAAGHTSNLPCTLAVVP